MLVTFRGSGAEVVLRPTASIEIAKARLQDVRTGGASPLAAGIDAARDLVNGTTGDHALDPTIVIVTDGRATDATANPGREPLATAREALRSLASTGARIILIDTENGHTRLGHVARLAEEIRADYIQLDQTDPASLERAVRSMSTP